jgi:hypothetical protein
MKNLFPTNLNKEYNMKQTLKRIIRNVKSINGNSLAEFATTTALMATLAATAAPKLSEMSEGAKSEKSMNEIDKILTQARNFYQDTADTEGRGRFPGQDKYDVAVGDYTGATAQADVITAISGGFTQWDDTEGSKWRSVFGIANADNPQAAGGNVTNDESRPCDTCPGGIGHEEWLGLFNGNPLASKYQDGHFIYVVVAGGQTGNSTYPPVLYVADAENPSDFNNLLEP